MHHDLMGVKRVFLQGKSEHSEQAKNREARIRKPKTQKKLKLQYSRFCDYQFSSSQIKLRIESACEHLPAWQED